MEEGELLEDEWEGFTACSCCELFESLLFSFDILLVLIGCFLLLLIWLNYTLSSAVIFAA